MLFSNKYLPGFICLIGAPLAANDEPPPEIGEVEIHPPFTTAQAGGAGVLIRAALTEYRERPDWVWSVRKIHPAAGGGSASFRVERDGACRFLPSADAQGSTFLVQAVHPEDKRSAASATVRVESKESGIDFDF